MAHFADENLPPNEIKAKQHPWAKTIKGLNSHRIKHAHNSIKNPKYFDKEEKHPDPDRVQFTVIGDRVTKAFNYCKNMVIGLHKYKWKDFDVPIIKGCSTIEWPEVWHGLKVRFPGDTANCLLSSVAVFVNGQILGGENELRQLVDSKYCYNLCLDYYNEGVAELSRYIRSSGRPYTYMHVSIDDTHIGTLIFMLYADIVPYTCENFLRLCKESRGGYGGTPVHRIVKDGWIQCGGFGLKSSSLSCENFIIPFDKRGVLAMTNNERDYDCSTQFFVLLQPAPWMNQKYVAFGQLIEGAATLEKIESVKTWYESPTSKIILYQCGILNMECHDFRFNKEVSQYIEDHTEDLNMLAKHLWERILQTVFLKAQLREIKRFNEQYGEGAEERLQKSVTEEFETTGEGLSLEEIEEKEDIFKPFSISSTIVVEEPQRPYYIPLTDVPYPGDVESDFDLKRLLKGDYCLECDLDVDADRNKKIGIRQSLLFYWHQSEPCALSSEEISLNSDERKEVDDFAKNDVDRISFAGGVVKNIAKSSPKHTDLFSAQKQIRPPTSLTDEELRMFRKATADITRQEKRTKKVTVAVPDASNTEGRKQIKRRQTGFPKDDADLIRLFAKKEDDDDDDFSNHDDENELPKKVTVAVPDASNTEGRKQIKRRQTGFPKDDADLIRLFAKKEDDDDDDFSNHDDENELPKKVTVAVPDASNTEGRKQIKRRQTGFPKDDADLIRLFAKKEDDDDDDFSNHDDENELPKKVTVAVPDASNTEGRKQIKRRQTGFPKDDADLIRLFAKKEDDDDDDFSNHDDENELPKKPTVQIDPGVAEPSNWVIRRKPTGFWPTINVHDNEDDDDDEDIHFPAQSHDLTASSESLMYRRSTSNVRPGALPVNDLEEYDDKDSSTTKPTTKLLQKPKFAEEDDKYSPKRMSPVSSAMKHRPTVFIRASDIRLHESFPEGRVSGLTRLYEEVHNDEPGPTLKYYKPTAELKLPKHVITHTLLLKPSEESMLVSPHKYHHHAMTLQKQFDHIAHKQHDTKVHHQLSFDQMLGLNKFEHTFTHSISAMEFAKKRPTITVSDYQLKNRQYVEALDRKATPLLADMKPAKH